MALTNFSLEEYLAHPEKKVVTRSGEPVRIVCTDRIGNTMVVLVGKDEDVLTYCTNGTTGQAMKLPSDLFFAGEEPELSEFEYGMLRYLQEAANKKDDAEIKKATRKYSKELLDLARKELEPETLERLEAAYKNQDDVVYENGKRDGKAEALKDLPRWRKCADCTPKPKWSNEWIFSIDSENVTRESAIVHKGYFLPLDGLEKLPGFKEDEK